MIETWDCGKEISGLKHRVRVKGAQCLPSGDVAPADATPEENADQIMLCGRAPFPSISGHFPTDKRRQFWNDAFDG